MLCQEKKRISGIACEYFFLSVVLVILQLLSVLIHYFSSRSAVRKANIWLVSMHPSVLMFTNACSCNALLLFRFQGVQNTTFFWLFVTSMNLIIFEKYKSIIYIWICFIARLRAFFFSPFHHAYLSLQITIRKIFGDKFTSVKYLTFSRLSLFLSYSCW